MTVLACAAITAAHSISCDRPSTHQAVVEFAPGLTGAFSVCGEHATGVLPALWTRVVSAHVIAVELRLGSQPDRYDVVQAVADFDGVPPALGSVVRDGGGAFCARLLCAGGLGGLAGAQMVRIGQFCELSDAANAIVDRCPTVRAALDAARMELVIAA